MKHTVQKNNILSSIGWFFAKRYRITSLFFIILLVVGGMFYFSLLKREGFPPINVPVSAIQGTYIVNDAKKVDNEVVQPIVRAVSSVDGIKDFTATADSNFYSVIVQFNDDIDVDDATKELNTAIKEQVTLPQSATYTATAFNPSQFDNKYDLLLAVYDNKESSYEELSKKAQTVAQNVTSKTEVETATAISVSEEAADPQSGQISRQQTKINRIGVQENGTIAFYPAISIGVTRSDSVDDIQLSKAVNAALKNETGQSKFNDTKTIITADFATTIDRQISSLQSNLISGLIAVLIVSLLLISWRAALVIALFIPTVLASTFLGLGMLGFTLNTITLFAVILTLGLFVDDATIMVEAIDFYKKDKKRHKDVLKKAITRVGIASLAGSLTTILVFTPMLFISGVLGSFIRLLPLTVIISLVSSFAISILVVPFLTRPLILSGKNRKTWLDKLSFLAPVEDTIGAFLSKLPLLYKTNRKKSRIITASMIGLSLVSIAAGGLFATKLSFNIFPPTKDSDTLIAQINFEPKTDIATANGIAKQVDKNIVQTLGNDLEGITYLSADQRAATIEISLTPFGTRDRTSHYFVDALSQTGTTVHKAEVRYSQRDIGPPSQEYPFEMRVFASYNGAIEKASNEIKDFLKQQTIEVAGAEPTTITQFKTEGLAEITRAEAGRFGTIKAQFKNKDAGSSAVLNTQKKISQTYDTKKLAALGLSSNALDFNVSQESENSQSFNSVGIGLIVALAMMYLLLVILFNSFSQPLLIFTAIPFSFFGVFFGLWLTNNSLSFFVMVGLLGLIGIVVNNSILLTEYANQEKESGKNRHEAISAAIKDRIRPLLATTLTTIFALVPLAMSDPFWQPLAYTLIFGLTSSTILVIVSFPYYYLGVERLREWKNRRYPSLR
jgi:multidrug efflux pump subunit AcrB